MKKIKILPNRYIRIEKSNTVALMHKNSGKLFGRIRSKKPDGTKVRRVIKDVDVDRDGKVDFFGGTIIGRTKAVKSSKRARGYVRRL